MLGPPGVGKSRLLVEFDRWVDGLVTDVLWHTGRCLSYGDGVAYWALAEMVRQRLGIPEDASEEDAARKLAHGLDQWILDADEREFLSPRLGALIGVGEPGLDRQDLFAGWRLFLERLADHSPVVLVFEDLHWADAGLLDFIDHLLTWSAQKPIFILALARPELAERRASLVAVGPHTTPVFLDPLGDGAIATMLDELVLGLPAGVRDQIVARAEGIPLYALETVRALADRGALAEGADGRLELAGDVGELEVPTTLSSLITARLDALPAEERTLVKDVAVFGGSFPRPSVAAMTEIPEERIDALLDSLVRKQVFVIRADPLSPDSGQYGFGQTMVRTVAYEMLTKRERKPRHLAAAAHLREAFPNEGEDVAEVIASHLLDAFRASTGDPDEDELRSEALEALRRAIRRAENVGAPDTAEAALPHRNRARGRRGASGADGEGGRDGRAGRRYGEAIAIFEEAVALHRAAGREREAARLAGRIGQALRFLGRNEEAIERLEAALEVLGADRMDADVANVNFLLGEVLVFAGRVADSREPLQRAIATARRSRSSTSSATRSSRRRSATPSSTAGCSSASCSRPQAGCGAPRAQLRVDARPEQPRRGVAARRPPRRGRAGSRRVDRRRPPARGSRLHPLRHRQPHGMPSARGPLGEIDRLLAGLDVDAADEAELGHVYRRVAMLSLLRGDVGAAEQQLARLARWEATEDLENQMHLRSVSLMVSLAKRRIATRSSGGRVRAGVQRAPGLEPQLGATGVPRHRRRRRAQAALDVAAGLTDFVGNQPPGLVSPFMRAQVARGRGTLALARGEDDAVEPLLTEAMERFTELGYPYWLARTQSDLAAWLIAHGRASEAEPLLDEATATLERLGAAPALERAQLIRAGASSGSALASGQNPG